MCPLVASSVVPAASHWFGCPSIYLSETPSGFLVRTHLSEQLMSMTVKVRHAESNLLRFHFPKTYCRLPQRQAHFARRSNHWLFVDPNWRCHDQRFQPSIGCAGYAQRRAGSTMPGRVPVSWSPWTNSSVWPMTPTRDPQRGAKPIPKGESMRLPRQSRDS